MSLQQAFRPVFVVGCQRSGSTMLGAMLGAHPDVALAAVIGGRTAGGNEEVLAFVQPVAGRWPDVDELRRHAAAHLAPYKRPSRIILVEALPATPAGKVLKARLAEQVRAGVHG